MDAASELLLPEVSRWNFFTPSKRPSSIRALKMPSVPPVRTKMRSVPPLPKAEKSGPRKTYPPAGSEESRNSREILSTAVSSCSEDVRV